MLSGEGNENGEKKNNRSNYQQKATLHVLHTFFVHFFAVVLHDYNVKLFGENVVRVLVHFFFTAAYFYLTLAAASIFYFVTAAAKFSCCSSNKKCLLFFLSLALDLCRPFSRWASLACRLLSLSFSCSIFQICGHDN